MPKEYAGGIFYSVREVAELFDVNSRTALRWMKKGEMTLRDGDVINLSPFRHPVSGQYYLPEYLLNDAKERIFRDLPTHGDEGTNANP